MASARKKETGPYDMLVTISYSNITLEQAKTLEEFLKDGFSRKVIPHDPTIRITLEADKINE